MNWEVINGVTGIIGAISALTSIIYLQKSTKKNIINNKIISTYKFMSFLLACSGWVLLCLCYLWLFKPYGSYPLPYQYQQFFGFLLIFPAMVLFGFGLKLMIAKNNAQ